MNESYGTQIPPTQGPPKNWLVESILATIFCCMPFGIAGIVFASQVNSKYAAGDYEGALQASRDAAKWTKVSFVLQLLLIIGTLIFVFAFGGLAIWRGMN
jgi:hypothetical protein